MNRSVWIYVDAPTHCVKVFGSFDAALEWLKHHDPDGLAVEYPVEQQSSTTARPRRTDVETLVEALLEARIILSQYLLPRQPQDARTTVAELVNALTGDDVMAALSRIERRQRFGLVEAECRG